MEFVQAGGQQREQQRQFEPAEAPSPRSRQSGAPGKEREHAQQSVAHEVNGLANQIMDHPETVAKDPAEQRIKDLRQDPGGMLGGKNVSGEQGQDAEPQ